MSKDLHLNQLKRLRKVEGQIRGVQKMIEEDRYCMDILTQLKAIKSALSRVEESIIENHLDHCVHRAVSSSDRKAKEEVIDEIRTLLRAR